MKKVVKEVRKAILEAAEAQAAESSGTVFVASLPAERKFWVMIHEDLETAEDFYEEQVVKAVKDLYVLIRQAGFLQLLPDDFNPFQRTRVVEQELEAKDLPHSLALDFSPDPLIFISDTTASTLHSSPLPTQPTMTPKPGSDVVVIGQDDSDQAALLPDSESLTQLASAESASRLNVSAVAALAASRSTTSVAPTVSPRPAKEPTTPQTLDLKSFAAHHNAEVPPPSTPTATPPKTGQGTPTDNRGRRPSLILKAAASRLEGGVDKPSSPVLTHIETSSELDGVEETIGDSNDFAKLDDKNRAHEQSRLQKNFLEYYRGLLLLEQYCNVNVEGFQKILKKHDKYVGTDIKEEWFDKRVATADFYKRSTLLDIIRESESAYAAAFTSNDHGAAMTDLRVPEHAAGQTQSGREALKFDWPTFLIGLWSGITMPVLVVCGLILYYSDDPWEKSPQFESILTTFRAAAVPIFLAWAWATDSYVWTVFRINFGFIFEFNPRSQTRYQRLFSAAAIFTAIWAVCLLGYLLVTFDYILPGVNPGVFPAILAGLLLLSLAYFQARSQWWLLRTIGGIMIAPFKRVRFRHFFLADQLNSLVIFILDLQHTICFMSWDLWRGSDTCLYTFNPVVQPLLVVIPAWWRLAQEGRRIYDGGRFWNFLNAGKYSSGILVGLLAWATIRNPDSSSVRAAWIVALVWSTLYTYSWDVYRDWGLLQGSGASPKHPLLRKKMLLPLWSYRFAVFINLFLRLLWVFTLSPTFIGATRPVSWLLRAFIGIAEILRRAGWNVLRLENEQINNIGKFRAVAQVPVPQDVSMAEMAWAPDASPGEEDPEEDDDDNDDDGNAPRRGSLSIRSKSSSVSTVVTSEIRRRSAKLDPIKTGSRSSQIGLPPVVPPPPPSLN